MTDLNFKFLRLLSVVALRDGGLFFLAQSTTLPLSLLTLSTSPQFKGARADACNPPTHISKLCPHTTDPQLPLAVPPTGEGGRHMGSTIHS